MSDPASEAATRLTDAQRLEWLRLIRSENVGPRTFRALINQYGGAGAALAALPELARRRTGKSIKIASLASCERELEDLARIGARLIGLGEADYPAALRAIDAPPPLLAVRGDVQVLGRSMVAIVGSRNASASGLAFTERLARDLAAAGHVIVSGLARGIDTRAHKATVETGAVAVLAGGLDRIYPAENTGLLEDIVERGCAISEMPLGWDARGRDFPRRNRMVSGLSRAVIVVEAARRSGSLITARFALEQGREVFAVPGSPLDPRAEGPNDLLRQGATLCANARDVLDALEAQGIDAAAGRATLREADSLEATEPLWDECDLFGALPTPQTARGCELDEAASGELRGPLIRALAPQDVRARVLELLGPSPVSVDELIRSAECPASRVRTVLLELELEGLIEKHGGGLLSLLIKA